MMARQQTLVILSPGFPKDEADTACIPPQQVFVKALQAAYPQVKIVVLSFEYPDVPNRYNWHGVEVVAFGGRRRGKLFRLRNWVRVWAALRELNKTYEVIGLLSFWLGQCAFVGQCFARIHGLKHLCWILGQDAKAGNGYARLMRPKGEELVALSDFIAREYHQNYKVLPAHIIPPGIDKSMFPKGNPTRDIDVLGAGSLIPLKQYEVFVHVVNHLSGYYPNIKAVICGKGPERGSLAMLIGDLKLERNITLMDELPHAEVLGLMQRTKVFLHTSEYEGFGAVLLEALYAGAHVVSFVKPMDMLIEHHHVVDGIVTMQQVLVKLLADADIDHQPVMVFPIEEIAGKVMTLFTA